MNAKRPRRQGLREVVLFFLGVLASWRSFGSSAQAQLPPADQIQKDLSTIYSAHQANPDFSHRGELCHRVEHVLQRQCEYFQMHLVPWQKDPQALLVKDKALYATGNHLEWSIRTNAQCAMGLATLARATGDDKAKDDAIAMLRFLLPTHHAGGVMCDDGKQWHSQWQSAFWAASMGRAVWLLWDDLDPKMKWLAAKMIEEEADRFINRPVDHQVVSDTKAEENAWNSMVISLAYNMLPNHPHHKVWGETAQRWQVSSWVAQRDLDQNPMVDGRPLKEWIRFPNIYDDYTVENHDRVHPDYMAAIYLSQFQTLHYDWGGNPLPECVLFNTNKVHASLAQFALPDGSCMYVSGEDWPLHRNADYFDTHTAEAVLFNDPVAARLARNSLDVAEKMLARYPHGPIYAPGETSYVTTHGADLEGYATAYLLMAAHGEGPAPVREKDLWNKLRGLHIFEFGQLAVMRSEHGVASFGWGRQIMGMVMPFRQDMLLTPYDRGLVGDITVNGKRDVPHMKKFNRVGIPSALALAGVIERAGGAIEQRFAFCALPDGRAIYVDSVKQLEPFAGTIDLGTLGVLNDKNWIYHQPQRTLTYESGQSIFRAADASAKSKLVSIQSPWLNLDGLGIVALSSCGQTYDPRPTKASGRLEQLFHLNHPRSLDNIKPTVLVFYPQQDASQTKSTAAKCKLASSDDRHFSVTLDDAKVISVDLEKLEITESAVTGGTPVLR